MSQPKMKKSVKKKWVAALRSGKYKQGRNALRTEDNEFCCLGVLCEVARLEGVIPNPIHRTAHWTNKPQWFYGKGSINETRRTGTLPVAVREWAGLDDDNPYLSGRTASSWNDAHGRDHADFNKIADLVEEYL